MTSSSWSNSAGIVGLLLLMGFAGCDLQAGNGTPSTPSPTLPTGGRSSQPPAGPYATLQAADAYVRSYPLPAPLQPSDLAPVQEDVTWGPASTLHVIGAQRSCPTAGCGHYFFFFVNGYVVGTAGIGYLVAAQPLNDATFTISYKVLQSTDALCCPSGGVASVRHRWNGKTLVHLDPLQGDQPFQFP